MKVINEISIGVNHYVKQDDKYFFGRPSKKYKKLPAGRFKKRPSRFASIYEIAMPDADTRKLYISSKLQADEKVDLNQWVDATQGFTIDHIKDLIVSVLCLDVPFQEAIDRLKNLQYDEDKDKKHSSRERLLLEHMFNINSDYE